MRHFGPANLLKILEEVVRSKKWKELDFYEIIFLKGQVLKVNISK